MYKPFKLSLNTRWQAAAASRLPGFTAPISLGRGGGVTFRRRLGPDSLFLLLTHTADRDRCKLQAGWARGADFSCWADAESWLAHPSLDEARRRRTRLRTDPAATLAATAEAVFDTADLQDGAVMADIELSTGVPYDDIARALAEHPSRRTAAEIFLGDFLVQSVLAGERPPRLPANPALGLHTPYPVADRLLSWECWFEHVLRRPPDAQELAGLCDPVLAVLQRHTDVLAGWLARAAAALPTSRG